MALIVVQSFPNQQTLERSYPTKCPESDQPQLGHPLRSRGDTSLQTLPKVGTTLENPPSCPRFDSLIQVHLLGFESPWGGPLPPLQPRPRCDGAYASYLSTTGQPTQPTGLTCPRRQLLCTLRNIGVKLQSLN